MGWIQLVRKSMKDFYKQYRLDIRNSPITLA